MTLTRSRSTKICPVCNSTSRKLFDVDHYIIRSCHICAHQFTEMQPDSQHVNDVFDDAYFRGKEGGYGDYLGEGKFLKIKGRQYAKLMQRYFKKPGRLLDVGAAAGFLLQGFRDRDWQGYGIEPNARMVEQGKKSGLRMVQTTMEEFQTTEKFDLILMVQVIAQLTDLQEAFRIAADITQSNGVWLIETDNRDSLKARLGGENWRGYQPPSSLHWFSPKDLQRLAAQYGFQEVAQGNPRLWVNAAHAKFSLRQRKGILSSLLLLPLLFIPDRCPLPFVASDRFWTVYKKLW